MKGKFPASFDTYQEVLPGDFVFCLFDVEETPRTVGMSRYGGMITGAYDVYTGTGGIADRYLERLLLSFDSLKSLQPLYRGLRKTLPRGAFESLRICWPSAAEQELIVRYLDNAELRIARAIKAKMQMLDLLTEQQLAMFEAVLLSVARPGVETRSTEWFGAIPEDWPLKRLKYVVRESNVRSTTGTEPHYSMSQRLGLVPAEIGGGVLLSKSYAKGKVCEPGDIVLNRLKAHLGVFALAPNRCVVSPDYTVLRVSDGSDPNFVCALLRSRSFRPLLRMSVRGLVEGFWRLYTPELMSLSVPIPPVAEQSAIMTQFNMRNAPVAETLAAVKQEIALLREYRTRLISDVVTGKKDVRAEAAGMKDVDPAELAAALAGGTALEDTDLEVNDDAE